MFGYRHMYIHVDISQAEKEVEEGRRRYCMPITRMAEYGTSSTSCSFAYAETWSILVAWRQPFGTVKQNLYLQTEILSTGRMNHDVE